MDIEIARPFPHREPGQSEDYAFSAWSSQIAQIETGKMRSIIHIGNIKNRRDFCDVCDVIQVYILLLQGGRRNERYNVCSGTEIALREISDTLSENVSTAVPTSIDIDTLRLRTIDSPFQLGSCRKISDETIWAPGISICTTFHDLLESWWSMARGRC